MCTQSELQLILSRLLGIYKQVYKDNLKQVLLYGSYARGDYDDESDIDVVAIVEGDRKTLQEQLKRIWDISSELEIEYCVVVSPTVIPLSEYNEFKHDLPYYHNIEQEGVELIA